MLCSVAFPSDRGFIDRRVLPPWSAMLLFYRHADTHESQDHLKPQEQVLFLHQWRLTVQEKEEEHLNTQSILEGYQCSVPALYLTDTLRLPLLLSFLPRPGLPFSMLSSTFSLFPLAPTCKWPFSAWPCPPRHQLRLLFLLSPGTVTSHKQIFPTTQWAP